MNIKNMEIIKWKDELIPGLIVHNGFTINYNCGAIHKTEYDNSRGTLTFFFGDKQIINVNICETVAIDMTYATSFGIAPTKDGRFFFIQSWENGLYCFETKTGALVWHHEGKKAGHLIVKDSVVICCFCDQDISIINLHSGETVSKFPYRNGSCFVPITDDLFLIGPKRAKYIILDSHLREVCKIPNSLLNPNGMDTFIIHDAYIQKSNLSVSAVAYSHADFKLARANRAVDELIRKSHIIRNIVIPELNKQIP